MDAAAPCSGKRTVRGEEGEAEAAGTAGDGKAGSGRESRKRPRKPEAAEKAGSGRESRKRPRKAGRGFSLSPGSRPPEPYVSAGSRTPLESRALRRSTAFVCNCETRDSVTPMTSPISRSVNSS